MSEDVQKPGDEAEKVKLEIEVPKKQLETAGSGQQVVPAESSTASSPDPGTEVDKLHDKGKMTIAGYTAGDIIGSVAHPPHPEDDPRPIEERPAKTKPSMVSQVLILIGIGFVVLGALFLLVNVGITIILSLLGAASAAAGLIISKVAQKQ